MPLSGHGFTRAAMLPSRVGLASSHVFIKVNPGGYVVTRKANQVLVTVLGSCVAACIRDPVAGLGGMNHFMLPSSADGEWCGATASLRYGNFAMEKLINDILRGGGRRDRLQAKLFGGGHIFGNTKVGDRNANFAEAYLHEEGISVLCSDLGGQHARRVHYEPVHGRAMVRCLPREDKVVAQTENRFGATLKEKSFEGSIELFD